ncbi:hypothetical protein BGX28_006446 [Mortierella sp. GBA30]|nr:hypothetical protein BGX28_006446 [Mortierella sp. GBA30]
MQALKLLVQGTLGGATKDNLGRRMTGNGDTNLVDDLLSIKFERRVRVGFTMDASQSKAGLALLFIVDGGHKLQKLVGGLDQVGNALLDLDREKIPRFSYILIIGRTDNIMHDLLKDGREVTLETDDDGAGFLGSCPL